MENQTTPAPEPAPEGPKKSKTSWVILVVVILIAALAVVLIMSQPADDQEEVVVEVPQATVAKDAEPTPTPTPVPEKDDYEGWVTYENKSYGYTFKYPAGGELILSQDPLYEKDPYCVNFKPEGGFSYFQVGIIAEGKPLCGRTGVGVCEDRSEGMIQLDDVPGNIKIGDKSLALDYIVQDCPGNQFGYTYDEYFKLNPIENIRIEFGAHSGGEEYSNVSKADVIGERETLMLIAKSFELTDKYIDMDKVYEAFEKHSPDADYSDDNITVYENFEGKFIAGGIIPPLGGGAHYWAAKVNGEWEVVLITQDTPSCSVFEPYGFPQSMIDICI